MMGGNPNWFEKNFAACCLNESHLRSSSSSSQFVYGESNSSNLTAHDDHLNPVRSNWRQLLLGGEEDRYGASLFQQQKKLENWEDQVYLNLNPSFTTTVVDVKQENPQYHHLHAQNIQVSSPTSCITTLSNNIFNFSAAHKPTPPPAEAKNRRHNQHHSSECNSTSSGGVSKKARIQHSSAQPALKVRKEKLGDRITALHQLVSPFGKTDTASVLSEAIGYIRFLQGQIEALSSPYMRNASGSSTVHHQHSDLQISQEGENDLKSRGLCLVPISCTQNVGNDNGADYWAPAALGGGF